MAGSCRWPGAGRIPPGCRMAGRAGHPREQQAGVIWAQPHHGAAAATAGCDLRKKR